MHCLSALPGWWRHGIDGSIEAALDVAEYFRLGAADAARILDEVRAAASGWDRAAASYGIGERERARMATAFTSPDQR